MPSGPDPGAALALLRSAIQERFLGQERTVELLLAAFFGGGHVLIEGAPGLGKTRLVRTVAALLDLRFGRVQCTPDLLPGDVTGGEVLEEHHGERAFRFVPGPVFCNVLLADEVNRATPRTQAALLEAMEERQVTSNGATYPLPQPFFLAATQNPIELEGTYPLPEAQLDRFLFKLEVPPPDRATLERILELPAQDAEAPLRPLLSAGDVVHVQRAAAGVPLPAGMLGRVAEIVRATHPEHEEAVPPVREHVRYGASPRAGRAALAGGRALALLRGRRHVAPADLRDALYPALRHRILLRYEAQAAGVRPDALVDAILERYPVR
ncbi:MAG: AAA family ATPase [Planctomycetota bacterium]|nr:MAG: AAA family ATPase [Planctomycetota bacterium]